MRNRLALSVLVLMLVAPGSDLAAQQVRAGLMGGRSIPTGSMGERREPGWEVGGVALLEWSQWALRADLTYSRYGGKETKLSGAVRHSDLWNVAMLANALYLVPAEGMRLYVLSGAGMHRTQSVGESPNIYGWVPGAQAGLGMRIPVGVTTVFAEVRWNLILSDYGNGDFQPSTYVPVSVGVLF